MTSIKAIETHYKGYRFRSRLEARWAVFFDALGIRWEYEKEGFSLPSGPYLPDFWLPEFEVWAEVKAADFTYQEIILCDQLVESIRFPCVLLVGSPDLTAYSYIKKIDSTETHWAKCLVDRFGPNEQYFKGKPRFLEFYDSGSGYQRFSEEYHRAVTAARSARFEHGELP